MLFLFKSLIEIWNNNKYNLKLNGTFLSGRTVQSKCGPVQRRNLKKREEMWHPKNVLTKFDLKFVWKEVNIFKTKEVKCDNQFVGHFLNFQETTRLAETNFMDFARLRPNQTIKKFWFFLLKEIYCYFTWRQSLLQRK